MNPIMLQTMYYAAVMLMTFIFVDMLTQGFVHKFLIVFASLGRKTFIKIRHSTYDGIAIGKEDEGFIVFKYMKKEYRIPIPNDTRIFYRFLFCQWVDVDGEKWALCKCDYTPIAGYDPVKIQSFIKRILMMPQEDDTFKKTVIIVLVIMGILIIGLYIFDFTLMQKSDRILALLAQEATKAAEVKAATI